jgi:PIN domain nuclease of toxin-antitoxin system
MAVRLLDSAVAFPVSRRAAFRMSPLSITLEHAPAAAVLPPVHADPRDRFPVAPAQAESIPILTADTILQQHEVEIRW